MKSRGIGEQDRENKKGTQGRPRFTIPFTGHSGSSTFMAIDRAHTVSADFVVLALALQPAHRWEPCVDVHTAREIPRLRPRAQQEVSHTPACCAPASPEVDTGNTPATSLVVLSLRLAATPRLGPRARQCQAVDLPVSVAPLSLYLGEPLRSSAYPLRGD
jgi:hypothetical protein